MSASADVLRRAAAMVDEGAAPTACSAIVAATWGCMTSKTVERVARTFMLFKPDGVSPGSYWWRVEQKNARVLALLFAAAMCENDGH